MFCLSVFIVCVCNNPWSKILTLFMTDERATCGDSLTSYSLRFKSDWLNRHNSLRTAKGLNKLVSSPFVYNGYISYILIFAMTIHHLYHWTFTGMGWWTRTKSTRIGQHMCIWTCQDDQVCHRTIKKIYVTWFILLNILYFRTVDCTLQSIYSTLHVTSSVVDFVQLRRYFRRKRMYWQCNTSCFPAAQGKV